MRNGASVKPALALCPVFFLQGAGENAKLAAPRNAYYTRRVGLESSYTLSNLMRWFRTSIAFCLACSLCLSSAAWAQIYQYTAPDGTLIFSTTPRSDSKLEKVIGGRTQSNTSRTVRDAPSRPNPNPDSSANAFDGIIRDAASAYGVPFALIKAVIRAESAFNPHAISHAGAMGLMQLMPATAESLNCADPFSPRDNVFAGTQYLKILADRYNGDMNLVLAAYNAGSGAVARAGGIPFENTRRYIERVFSFYLEYLNE